MRNMATEINTHSCPHPPRRLSAFGTNLFVSCVHTVLLYHIPLHTLLYLSVFTPARQATRYHRQHYLISRSPPQIFFKHILASFAHGHSRFVVCDAMQLVRIFLIVFFVQVLVATGFLSIARTTSSFLRLEVRIYIHTSLLQFLKTFGTKMSRSHKWVRNLRCRL